MVLSKAFDCAPHDLLNAKLEAYGINENLLACLHSYLSNRKQCVRINNVTSDFKTIISGVQQGAFVGPILFNCFFNDFFYFIEKASVHNFADDNTLSMFEETIQNLFAFLETESNTAIEWLQNNKMMVNPGMFQAIIIDKKKKCHTNETFKIGDKKLRPKKEVLFPEIGRVKNCLSVTRPHSRICIRIYIFNFKKHQTNKQKQKKTRIEKSKRN